MIKSGYAYIIAQCQIFIKRIRFYKTILFRCQSFVHKRITIGTFLGYILVKFLIKAFVIFCILISTFLSRLHSLSAKQRYCEIKARGMFSSKLLFDNRTIVQLLGKSIIYITLVQ